MEHSCQVYLIFFQDRSWTNLVEDEQGHPSPGVDHTAVIYECVSKNTLCLILKSIIKGLLLRFRRVLFIFEIDAQFFVALVFW